MWVDRHTYSTWLWHGHRLGQDFPLQYVYLRSMQITGKLKCHYSNTSTYTQHNFTISTLLVGATWYVVNCEQHDHLMSPTLDVRNRTQILYTLLEFVIRFFSIMLKHIIPEWMRQLRLIRNAAISLIILCVFYPPLRVVGGRFFYVEVVVATFFYIFICRRSFISW